MSKPFVPSGHIGLVRACLQIATARYPERWRESSIPENERGLWNELGVSLNGEFLEEHVLNIIPFSRVPMTIDRMADFRDARDDLRQALYADRVTAFYTDDRTGRQHTVDRVMWASSAGATVLEKGLGWIDEPGPDCVCRYLYVTEDQLARAFAFISTYGAADQEVSGASANVSETPQTAQVLTKHDVEAKYRDWVAMHDGQSPPDRDMDLRHMREFSPNVSRKRLRDLRNTIAPEEWRRPGSRKKAP